MANKENTVCGRCSCPVYHAEQRLAINKVWHVFCFSCAICHKLLDSCTVNPYNGEIYCNACFHRVSVYDYDFDNNENSRRANTTFVNKSNQQTNKWIQQKPLQQFSKMQYKANENPGNKSSGISSVRGKRKTVENDQKVTKPPQQPMRNQNNKSEDVTKQKKVSETRVGKSFRKQAGVNELDLTPRKQHAPFEDSDDYHSDKMHKPSKKDKMRRSIVEYNTFNHPKRRIAPVDDSNSIYLYKRSQFPERARIWKRSCDSPSKSSNLYNTSKKRHGSIDDSNPRYLCRWYQTLARARSRNKVHKSRTGKYNNDLDKMYHSPKRARTGNKVRKSYSKHYNNTSSYKFPRNHREPCEDSYYLDKLDRSPDMSRTGPKVRGTPSAYSNTEKFKTSKKYHGPNRDNTWTRLGQDGSVQIVYRGLYKTPKYKGMQLGEIDDLETDSVCSTLEKELKDQKNEKNRRDINKYKNSYYSPKTNQGKKPKRISSTQLYKSQKNNRDTSEINNIDALYPPPKWDKGAPNHQIKKQTAIPNSYKAPSNKSLKHHGEEFRHTAKHPFSPNKTTNGIHYKTAKSNSTRPKNKSANYQNSPNRTIDQRSSIYKPKSNSSKSSRNKSLTSNPSRSLKYINPNENQSAKHRNRSIDHRGASYKTTKSRSSKLLKNKSLTSNRPSTLKHINPVRKSSEKSNQTATYRSSPLRTKRIIKSNSSRTRNTHEMFYQPDNFPNKTTNRYQTTKSNSLKYKSSARRTSEKSNQTVNYQKAPNRTKDAYNELYNIAIANSPTPPKKISPIRSTSAEFYQISNYINPNSGNGTYKTSISRSKSPTMKQPSRNNQATIYPNTTRPGSLELNKTTKQNAQNTSLELYQVAKRIPEKYNSDTNVKAVKQSTAIALYPQKVGAKSVISEHDFHNTKRKPYQQVEYTRQYPNPYKSSNSVQLHNRKTKGFFSKWFSCKKDKTDEELSGKTFDNIAFMNKMNTFKEKSKGGKYPMVEMKYYQHGYLSRNKPLKSPKNSPKSTGYRNGSNKRNASVSLADQMSKSNHKYPISDSQRYSFDKRYATADRYKRKSGWSQIQRSPERILNRNKSGSFLDRKLNPNVHVTPENNKNHIQYFANINNKPKNPKYGSEVDYGDEKDPKLLEIKENSVRKSKSNLIQSPRLVSGYYSRNFLQRYCNSCLPDLNDANGSNGDRCKRCKRMVYQVEKVKAGRSTYHDCCFTCYMCRRPLNSLNMLSRKSEVFCKHCHLKYYGPQTYGYGILPNLSF